MANDMRSQASQLVQVGADVFISYSRKDRAFVSRLRKALEDRQKRVWVDLQDILPAEDWLKKIQVGIEAANNVVFVVSPDSLSSAICEKEIAYTLQNHKRLIPILRRDVDG